MFVLTVAFWVASISSSAAAGANPGGAPPPSVAPGPSPGSAADPSSGPGERFFDGRRWSVGERLGPGALGRTRIALRDPLGRVTSAEVDGTAIIIMSDLAVRDAASVTASLTGAGVAVVRPLMARAGLWLVRDLGGADGLALAERLSRQLTESSGESVGKAGGAPGHHLAFRGITPNLHLPRRLHAAPDDPRYPGQWYLANLGIEEAWALSEGSAETTVVVVDNGCDPLHPDLEPKLDPGRDVVSADDDPSFVPGDPGNEHGTACAGIIGAATHNGEGIAGACPNCRLRCVRMLGADGESVPLSADVDAFQFALDVDAAVVSNSWGFVDAVAVPFALESAINTVFDAGRGGLGALVLFAAGNDDRLIGDDELLAVRGVLGVGAINNYDEKTAYTSFGPSLDLVAPTGTVTTDISRNEGAGPGDYFTSFGGTSSACPVAAGVAGLLVSAAPGKTSAELYGHLVDTVRAAPYASPDTNGHDPVYGYGILAPAKALRAALGIPEPTPEMPSAPSDEGCAALSPRLGVWGGLGLGLLFLGRRSRHRG